MGLFGTSSPFDPDVGELDLLYFIAFAKRYHFALQKCAFGNVSHVLLQRKLLTKRTPLRTGAS
jgi:hypothetical protein